MDKPHSTISSNSASGSLYTDSSRNRSASTVNTEHDSTVESLSSYSCCPTSSTATTSSSFTKSSDKHHSHTQLAKLLIPHRQAVAEEDNAGQRDIGPRTRYGRGLQRPSTHQYPSRGRRNSFRETWSDLIEKPARKAPTTAKGPMENQPGLASPASPTRRRSNQKSKSMEFDRGKANVHTYAGRHSNDWLFGGWDKIFRKKN